MATSPLPHPLTIPPFSRFDEAEEAAAAARLAAAKAGPLPGGKRRRIEEEEEDEEDEDISGAEEEDEEEMKVRMDSALSYGNQHEGVLAWAAQGSGAGRHAGAARWRLGGQPACQVAPLDVCLLGSRPP